MPSQGTLTAVGSPGGRYVGIELRQVPVPVTKAYFFVRSPFRLVLPLSGTNFFERAAPFGRVNAVSGGEFVRRQDAERL